MSKRGNGEGSVFPVKQDGKVVAWRAQVSLPDGRRRSKRFTLKKDAHAWASSWIQKPDEALASSRGLTYGEFADDLLKHWWNMVGEGADAYHGLSPYTVEGYGKHLSYYILPAFKDVKLTAIPRKMVDEWKFKLSEPKEKGGKGLSASTAKQVFSTLRNSLSVAQDWGLVTPSQVNLGRAPRVMRDRRVKFYSADQVIAFAEAAQGHYLESFFLMAIGCGLRTEELFALTWDDINWDARLVRVAKAVKSYANPNEGDTTARPRIHTVKSDKSRRVLVIPVKTCDALWVHKMQMERALGAGDIPHTEWTDMGIIWVTRNGLPQSDQNVAERAKLVARQAGIPPLSAYRFGRHTFAAMMSRSGVPLAEIAHYLGHSSTKVTAATYEHSIAEEGRIGRSATVMNDIFEGRSGVLDRSVKEPDGATAVQQNSPSYPS